MRISSYILGDVGEVLTASELRSLGLNVVRNIFIPTRKSYVEIDMIATSKYGVFVIENKNYKGFVTGKATDSCWQISYGNRLHKLYNPIYQNNTHINYLRKEFQDTYLVPPDFVNIVIFNDCTKLDLIDCDSVVFTLSDFIKYYTSICSELLLTEFKQLEYIKFFESLRVKGLDISAKVKSYCGIDDNLWFLDCD